MQPGVCVQNSILSPLLLLFVCRGQQDQAASNGVGSTGSKSIGGSNGNGVKASSAGQSKASAATQTSSSIGKGSSKDSKTGSSSGGKSSSSSSSQAAKQSSKRTLGLFERQEYEVSCDKERISLTETCVSCSSIEVSRPTEMCTASCRSYMRVA
jgi:hypothetical protein